MSNGLRKQIRENFDLKETDEIVEIWTTNDRVEWSETAFDIMKEILEQRLGEIPPQNEPVLEHVKKKSTKLSKKIPLLASLPIPTMPRFFTNPKRYFG